MKPSPLPVDRAPVRDGPQPDGRPEHELRLARALLRGERAAGAALWDHFSPLVRGLLGRAFGPEEGTEDALQEVFLRVFHKGKTLRDPACLRSFVVAVTVHFIRSELRKRRLRRAIMRPLGRRSAPIETTAPVAGPRLAVAALYRALDDLPVDERIAFTLRFFEGASLEDAAVLSGMSLATFKRRLAAAKHTLWARALADPWLSAYVDPAIGLAPQEGEA